MRPRHKTPQTFSLWMVDVLCCSLGSVIILWLYYSEQTTTKSDQVLRLEADIDSLRKKLSAGEIKVADLDKRLLSESEKKAALEQLLQKRVGELNAEIHELRHLDRSATDAFRERLAFEQLHRDEVLPFVLIDGVHGADAGMIQRRRRARLALEALEHRRVLRELGRQKLQCDETAEIDVLSFVHDAHAAAAELRHDPVVRHRSTNHELAWYPALQKCRSIDR